MWKNLEEYRLERFLRENNFIDNFLYIFFFVGDFLYLGVVFNFKILEEFGIDCKNLLDRNIFINLVIDYIFY